MDRFAKPMRELQVGDADLLAADRELVRSEPVIEPLRCRAAFNRRAVAVGEGCGEAERELASLVEAGAVPVEDVREIFASGVVLSVLTDDAAVRTVILTSGALDDAPEGVVHVNLATISPSLSEAASVIHAEKGVGYVAAPTFGGVPVAEAGKFNIVTMSVTTGPPSRTCSATATLPEQASDHGTRRNGTDCPLNRR